MPTLSAHRCNCCSGVAAAHGTAEKAAALARKAVDRLDALNKRLYDSKLDSLESESYSHAVDAANHATLLAKVTHGQAAKMLAGLARRNVKQQVLV